MKCGRWRLIMLAVAALTVQPAPNGMSGEPCDMPGRTMVDDSGRHLTCTTTLADGQPRWRTGQPDLPTR
ncbi:hypothetical protein AB0C04_29075 [Micromonospora sp. NPDC048909]|uniref:hypothetical protein n=1 Tax=Micromonospora sp. NPDC048909 TaxID=3155643 RepID=UPI0033EDC15E